MVWYGAPPTPWTAIVATRWWQLDRAPAEHAQTESVPSALVQKQVTYTTVYFYLYLREMAGVPVQYSNNSHFVREAIAHAHDYYEVRVQYFSGTIYHFHTAFA
jgi:hypothetical protein